MKTFQKVVLPAALSLAGLVSQQAMAAGTDAGKSIENTATMSYAVNGSTSNSVEAKTAFLVDVKIDFGWTAQTALNTTTAETLDAVSYYKSGPVQLSNSSNTKAFYSIGVTMIAKDGKFTVNSTEYTATASSNSTEIKYVVDTDGDGDLTDETVKSTGSTGGLLDLTADTTSQNLYVLIPSASVTGADNNILGMSVTAVAEEVLITGETVNRSVSDDSGNADAQQTIQFVYADAGNDNSELTYVGSTLSGIPDFSVIPDGDPNNDGFVKTSVVLSDPISLVANTKPKAIPGAIVRYTITLKNKGSGDALDVNISDPLDTITEIEFCDNTADTNCENITVTTDDGSSGTFTYDTSSSTATQVYVHYDTFPAGGSSTITFTAKVK